METVNLKSIMNNVKANAEWFALRKVYESDTYRIIRDGNPQANSKNVSHGIMVEVLKNGQFAYAASSDMSVSSVQEAINKATMIAESSLNKATWICLAIFLSLAVILSAGWLSP